MNRKQELKEKIGQLVINNNLKDNLTLEEIKELKSLIQEAYDLSIREPTKEKRYQVWKELTGGRQYLCYMLELGKKEAIPFPPPPPTPPPTPKSDSDSESKLWQGRTSRPIDKPEIIDTRTPWDKVRDEVAEKASDQRKKIPDWHTVNGTLKWGYYEINSIGEREFIEVSRKNKI